MYERPLSPDPEGARTAALKRARGSMHPARLDMLETLGLGLIADYSEGYKVRDVGGKEYLDLDLRAGVYNLGHRNPQVTGALTDALQSADMGFALFPGDRQSLLAERLANSTEMAFTVFAASGTEANDMALQIARRQTGKARILSCDAAYHGATGLSSAAGNPSFAARFKSQRPDEFSLFAVNDLAAIEKALLTGDIAAVLIEPSCNAAGYPDNCPEFWTGLRSLCDQHGALLIMDEIVTGLGRSGYCWGFQKLGVSADIVVTAKGLSGGIYPIAALMLSEKTGEWLRSDPFGFAGTFAGGELASSVGLIALEISTSPATLSNVRIQSAHFRTGLDDLANRYPIIKSVQQFGMLFSLGLNGENTGLGLIQSLFKYGVMTFPATNAPNKVNLKPGLLVDEAFCNEALTRIESALGALS